MQTIIGVSSPQHPIELRLDFGSSTEETGKLGKTGRGTMGGGGNRSRLPDQAELLRQPNWAGREGRTPKK